MQNKEQTIYKESENFVIIIKYKEKYNIYNSYLFAYFYFCSMQTFVSLLAVNIFFTLLMHRLSGRINKAAISMVSYSIIYLLKHIANNQYSEKNMKVYKNDSVIS